MTDPFNFRPDIEGWSHDILPMYHRWAEDLPDGARCVEVGVHHGRSLLFLAETLYEMGKYRSYLMAVDSWSWGADSFETFTRNLESVKSRALVTMVSKPSIGAAQMCDDETIDLAFLDGDHFYLSVKADIRAWWPKVKPGGILGGHDYGDGHAGVKQAVDEIFDPAVVSHYHSVWWVRK